MRAFDTCVLARYVLGDDPLQSPLARAAVARGGYVAATVLLELGWLLRSRYGFPRDALAATLRDIVRLPGIATSDESGLMWACDRIGDGADVGDVIHLVALRGHDGFVTFDDMAHEVGPDVPVPIQLLRT